MNIDDKPPTGRVVRMARRIKDPSALNAKDSKAFRPKLRLLKSRSKLIEPERKDQPNNVSASADDVGDMGLAHRFAEQHRAHVRYCPALGWLVWDGKRWERQGKETAKVMRYAKQTVRALRDEVLAVETDSDKNDKLFKFYVASTRRPRLEAMIALAKDELLVEADQLDRDPFVLNCLNGTVDMRNGKRRDHNPDDLITKLSPVPYDSRAKAPRWIKFLQEVFNGRHELISYVQRAIGYSLTADQREQCFWICFGGGSNGKGVFIRSIQTAAGDYAVSARPELLIEKHNESSRADFVALKGARFTVVSETGDQHRLFESQIKYLTGTDKLAARYLYQEPITFQPTHHIWLQTNPKPTVTGQDHAIWRRIKLIPFSVGFKRPSETIQGDYGKDPACRYCAGN